MLRQLIFACILSCTLTVTLTVFAIAETPSPVEETSSIDARLTQAKALYDAVKTGQDLRGWEPVLQEFLTLAKEGHPEAQETVGRMYRLGVGVEIDRCEATYWIDKAARAGRPWAQDMLGGSYWTGSGVFRDNDLAYLWYKTAVKNGRTEAVDSAARLIRADLRDARRVAALDETLRTWRAEDQPPANIIRMPNIWGLNVIMVIGGLTPCHFKF